MTVIVNTPWRVEAAKGDTWVVKATDGTVLGLFMNEDLADLFAASPRLLKTVVGLKEGLESVDSNVVWPEESQVVEEARDLLADFV